MPNDYNPGLQVLEGSLPADLNGAFLRNGPNPPRRPLVSKSTGMTCLNYNLRSRVPPLTFVP